MSLMQKIMFSLIKRGQKPYDPSQPHDYAAKRTAEEKGVPQKLPKGIMSREVELDGTDGNIFFQIIIQKTGVYCTSTEGAL